MKEKNFVKTVGCMVGVAALATFVVNVESYADVKTGNCGAGATYSYDDSTKTLTISGTGAIGNEVFTKVHDGVDVVDHSYANEQTEAFSNDIEKVVINNGITSIGVRTFCDEVNLKEVVIADTVTEISDAAFKYCDKMEKLQLSANLVDLGDEAFAKRYESTTVIDSIVIPKTVKNVGSVHGGPFTGSIIGEVTFEDGIEVIPDSILNSARARKIDLPESVTKIGKHAFAECEITSIVLPKYLKEIGFYAFSNCEQLKEITIYQLANIDEYAFSNINDVTKLSVKCKPGSPAAAFAAKAGMKVEKTKVPALKGIKYKASNLKYDVIDDKTDGTGKVVVCGIQKAKKSITIPKNVKLEGNNYMVVGISKNAFKGKKKIAKITIKSKTITSIGKNAFKKINSKAQIVVPKASYKTYKKMLNKKAGITKTMKIKKK